MPPEKTPLTEEQKLRRRVGRTIGRSAFIQRFKTENPGAEKDAADAAWETAQKAETKIGMQVLKILETQGYTVVEDKEARSAYREKKQAEKA